MRVLVISYFYPPANLISAVRLGKWTKYLGLYEIEPWVLTVESCLFPTAGELPIEISETRILRACLGLEADRVTAPTDTRSSGMQTKDRTESPNPFSTVVATLPRRWRPRRWLWDWCARYTHVRFPDRTLPWVPPAIQAGSALMRQQAFDAILSSHGPPSSHLIAAVLARRFQLPWVADFRDLWTQNHLIMRRGIKQRLETRLERAVLSGASSLITVSAPLAQQLGALHNKPVAVIPNGFDDEDFRSIQPNPDPERFRIVYTGGIYPGKRDPSSVFVGLALWRSAHPDLADRVEIHFVGASPQALSELAIGHGVQNQVFFHPPCANVEALRWQVSADALLLLEWDDPSAKGVYTGKVFEYLGARRPILATGPAGGVVEALLADTQSGELVRDPGAVLRFIDRWWERKQSDGTTRLADRPALLEVFTRRHQAGLVADALRAAVWGKQTGASTSPTDGTDTRKGN